MMIEGITSVLNNPSAQALGGSAAGADQAKLTSDFDDFLTLLTTQLQNQDPLEPMDSSEFTNQLVQFSSVEQQIATNQNLEALLAANDLQGDSALLGYLGKTVVAQTDLAAMTDSKATWLYDLGANTSETTLSIRDQNGRLVAQVDGSNAAGIHELQWDGKDLSGNQLPDGLYSLTVEAQNGAGISVATTSYARGLATELDRTAGRTLVKIGDLPIDPGTILAVKDPQDTTQDTTTDF